MLIQPVQPFQGAVDIDGLVIARLAQQPDEALRLAERIGADEMGAFGELLDRAQQPSDLLDVRRMAKDRQAERGLGDEDVARHGFEGGAGGIATALVVAGGGDGQAALTDGRLG
ncbi:hypothetical protein D3C72_688270 [compost metagenome]